MSRKLIRKYNSNVIDVLLANDPTQMTIKERDKNFIVDISANTGPSMFRPYKEDLNILLQYYSRK